jgi:hypothetical protein
VPARLWGSVRWLMSRQHLGAGIVLSAVATELLPAMVKPKNEERHNLAWVAILIGFFSGGWRGRTVVELQWRLTPARVAL